MPVMNKMLSSIKKHRHLLNPDWHKGYLFVGYFLLLVLIELITKGDWPFMILAWPLHIIPYRPLAAIVQLLFVYAVTILIDALWLHTHYDHTHKMKAH